MGIKPVGIDDTTGGFLGRALTWLQNNFQAKATGTPTGSKFLRDDNSWQTPTIADATTGSKGQVQLAGDLAGTAAAPTVAKIATATISGTPGTPSSSNFLRGDGTWATPAGGGGTSPALKGKVNAYVRPYAVSTTTANGGGPYVSGGGAESASAFVIPAQISVDQLVCAVDTAQASVNVEILIYSSDADGYPSSLLINSGGISVATGGIKTVTLGSSVVLAAGIYWGVLRTDTGTTVKFRSLTQLAPGAEWDTNSNNLTASGGNTLQFDPGSYASPNTTISSWAYTFAASDRPFIAMRRSV